MSAAPVAVPRRPRAAAWTPVAIRAVLALVLGLAITFTGGHSAGFGLVAFGIFGVVAGIVVILGGVLAAGRASRGIAVVQGVVTIVAGVAALALSAGGALPPGGVLGLVGVVSAFGILTGALELVAGLRTRRAEPVARDAILTGALTVLLGVAFLLVPPGYSQALGGIERITGTLTASVVLVGLLGAWGVLVGVLQAISAVSLRGAVREDGRARSEGSAA